MNIYLISQTKVSGYDTFRQAVVIAESAEQAATIHPDGRNLLPYDGYGDWVNKPEEVKVELLGVADQKILSPLLPQRSSVICADFHAG